MSDPMFHQLRVFLVVAEELNFGRAAARLHITQPPVTRHIAGLEAKLGIQLFNRTSRGVTLTEAGKLLQKEAGALLRKWDETVLHARRMSGAIGDVVRMGCVEAFAVEIFHKALEEMRSAYPDTEWSLKEGHTSELLQGLRADRFDCVIVRGPISGSVAMESAQIYEDELVMLVPEGRFPGRENVELAELSDSDFIVYNRDTREGLLPSILRACSEAGFMPRIAHEASGTELIYSLVAAGRGVAMVSHAAAALPRPGVQALRITDVQAASPIFLTWSKGERDSAMHGLVKILRSVAGTEIEATHQ